MLQNPLYLSLIREGGYLYPYAQQIDYLYSVGTNESMALALKLKRKMEYLGANILTRMAMAHIYFRDVGVEKYITDEIYSFTDVVGNICRKY